MLVALVTAIAAGAMCGALVGSQAAAGATPARRPEPSLVWTPSAGGQFHFGPLGAGQEAVQAFTLTNSGGRATAVIESAALTGSSAFSVVAQSCTGMSLGPRASCSITVAYTATTGEPDHAILIATAIHARARLAIAGTPAPSIAMHFETSSLTGYCGVHVTLTDFQPTSHLAVTYRTTRLGTLQGPIHYPTGVTTDVSGAFSGTLNIVISAQEGLRASVTIADATTPFEPVAC